MNWFLSLVVACITAIAGCLGAGFVANVFVGWFRITSREGAAGYYVVAFALLGLLGGLVIGLVGARIVAAGASPGFLKALGVGLGGTAGVLVLMLGIGWLMADFPPRIDGQDLYLDVEVRFPPTIKLPDRTASDLYRWNVSLTAMSRGRRQIWRQLRLNEARPDGDSVIVPTTVYIASSDPLRSLGVGCGDHGAQFFTPGLPAKPTRADMDWSSWQTSPHDLYNKPVPAEQAVAVRYRVQFEKP